MVNVSDEFISAMKDTMNSQGLNPSDFVVCFVVRGKVSDEVRELQIMFVPLRDFESGDSEGKAKLPFEPFCLIKRHGCWLVSDMNFLMASITKKIIINKEGQVVLEPVLLRGETSMVYFVGQCLIEHMKNNKLTQKELRANINLTNYKLNKIISGDYDLDLDTMCRISWELQGKNNKLHYEVMVEKCVDSSKKYIDFDE
jgi:hypothetical protein